MSARIRLDEMRSSYKITMYARSVFFPWLTSTLFLGCAFLRNVGKDLFKKHTYSREYYIEYLSKSKHLSELVNTQGLLCQIIKQLINKKGLEWLVLVPVNSP
jgi:hypothetical protein